MRRWLDSLPGFGPFGAMSNSVDAALKRATFSGMPVVKVSRGRLVGFVDASRDPLAIAGSNLTATKARLFYGLPDQLGCLPLAADATKPTEAETEATKEAASNTKNFRYALIPAACGSFRRRFMSGKHDHQPFEGHMHDFEAHIRAVEEDLEYYRAKRFEPRVIYLIRRGVVTFSDLLKARMALKRNNQFFKPRKPQGKNIEARVCHLEEWLDEYVKGIALVSARAVEAMDMVTEDNRKERGDYDDFFKIKKKEHHGTLEERMVNVEQDLKITKSCLRYLSNR